MAERINKESKLEKDLKEPKIILKELKRTAVHIPTQEDYNTLMRVYECGGWVWRGIELPTKKNNWNEYNEETCVGAENRFGFCYKEYYQKEMKYKIISTQEFYDKQKITPEMIKEINQWFIPQKI